MGGITVIEAMVFAAGFGKRMQPMSLATPKPLIALGGQPMLAHALEKLAGAGVEHAVVNAHYLGEQIAAFVQGWPSAPRLSLSDERDAILETGGGLKRALPLFKSDYIFCLNSDTNWLENHSNLQAMSAAFDPETTDALLLIAENANSWGDVGRGDFFLKENGSLERRGDVPSAPYTYTGAMILKADLVAGIKAQAFSLNLVFDALLAQGRIKGQVLQGTWMHVGTVQAYEEVNAKLKALAEGRKA
jgi:MurNAc alpha-1-phosphate uridylyltransferase